MKTLNKRNKGKISRELIKTIILSKRTKKRADLRDADLSGANLERVDLNGANLSGANLRGANLEGADFKGADLRDTYLSGAYLEGADLNGANLRDAYLEGANLGSVYNLYVFNAYDTSRRMVYCVKHLDTWYVQAGCFWGTIAELKAEVLATHKSKVYLHNIALLEQL